MTSEVIDNFARAAVGKTLLLGAPLALLLVLLVSPTFGASVFVGVLLAAGNLAAITWLGRMILRRAGPDASGSATPWVVLLVLKLGLLLGLAFVAMVLGVDPLGLAVGYTVFVTALVWQAVVIALQDEPRR